MKKALRDSVKSVIPEATIDEKELFKQLKKEVRKKCHTWESVPDRYVDHQ